MSVRLNTVWCCAAVSVVTMATGANAAVLLEVDLTITNQVTISATDGLSAVSASGGDSTGVYLDDFYGGSGGPLSATLVSGNLTNAENPSNNNPALFRVGLGADPGLNIFSWTPDLTATFTAGSLAFTGTATWSLDPSEYSDMLAGNTSGDLYFPADDVNEAMGASLLGTWVVVPGPGPAALLGVGMFGLIRRRRR